MRPSCVRTIIDLSRRLPSPPPLPEGLKPGPPDFVGIGAQKSGTSFWFELILQHPQVFAPNHFEGKVQPRFLAKERHFFDRFFQRQLEPQDELEYEQWFPRPHGMLVGEWTPRYSIEHWAPPLLKRLAPKAKILLIVRDPVARFVSGMNHRLRRHELTANDAHVNLLRGMYSLQLQMWQRHFEPGRIQILQFERCLMDVPQYLGRTFDFLGLDPILPDDSTLLTKPRNATKEQIFVLPDWHRRALVDAYRSDVSQLHEFFPEFDVSLWPNFRDE